MSNLPQPIFRVNAVLVGFAIWLTACSGASLPPEGEGLREQAAKEATAIIQRAQATALVLSANAQATAIILNAQAVQPDSTSTPAQSTSPALPPGSPQAGLGPTVTSPVNNPTEVAGTADASTVRIVGVGFAADGAYIMVQFTAPPSVARNWWQGSVSVTDEACGQVYNEIPVVPVIGPLIGRPVQEGQLGYVMLVNTSRSLRSGAKVSVVLGEYRQDHVTVQ